MSTKKKGDTEILKKSTASTKKKGDTEILKKSTAHLPCKLTDPELIEKGRQLAQVNDDIKAEQSRHDALKSEMKSAMAALEAKRDALAVQVSRREEHRDVEIEDLADYKAGKVYRTRLDVGEVIHERPLTDVERQGALALVD